MEEGEKARQKGEKRFHLTSSSMSPGSILPSAATAPLKRRGEKMSASVERDSLNFIKFPLERYTFALFPDLNHYA